MLHFEFIAGEEKSKRLLIMLHGLGDSIEGYRWMPAVLRLPWLNYALVNAPDEYYGGYSWYDFIHDPGPGVARSRKMLFELLDQFREKGFQSTDIVFGGFSQGCLMTIDVGLRYPQRLAGLIGISGYVFEPEKLLKELSPVALQQRFLITHGTDDSLIPLAGVEDQIKMLQGAGVQIDWRIFEKGHTIAGEEEVSAIRDFIVSCWR